MQRNQCNLFSIFNVSVFNIQLAENTGVMLQLSYSVWRQPGVAAKSQLAYSACIQRYGVAVMKVMRNGQLICRVSVSLSMAYLAGVMSAERSGRL
jgi:hypothetical protein